jgi:hypothetical protein
MTLEDAGEDQVAHRQRRIERLRRAAEHTSRPSPRARAHALGHQLGEHVDRHARAAKRRIPAHDLAYLPILGRRSGRAD